MNNFSLTKNYRISRDFCIYESYNQSWKKSSIKFNEGITVAKLFKDNNNFGLIIDQKNKKFLKGQLSRGKVSGARVNVLPNGEKLNKAFSLFSPKLTIHDEKSYSHWDVIYQNPNGKFAYLYTLKKEKNFKNKKFQMVDDFSKRLPRLKKNLDESIGKDAIVLPMIILLKTKMRIGNEVYYLKNHHKGLTTLKKKNIRISGKNIIFDFKAKDGVTMRITEEFSDKVIRCFKKIIKNKEGDDFVFLSSNGHLFKDTDFEKAFEKYCGEKFYPHIVRSHYATEEVKKFLERGKKIQKDEVKKLYLRIAEKLGHKKFSKKTNNWENNYQVTLHHYIQPKLVEKIDKIISCA